MSDRAGEQPLLPVPVRAQPPVSAPVLQAEQLRFRYDKDGADVLKDVSLTLHRGELFVLLGGNGAGKTTVLRILAGLQKPLSGTVSTSARLAYLPQNPQALFLKKTLWEDLCEQTSDKEDLNRVITLCQLAPLLSYHPYDLSGGEQQRAALAKVLLSRPSVLLLDEPTKGLDAPFKQSLGQLLKELAAQGVAILLVSHDVEFCAQLAHRCALLFDGALAAEAAPAEFFSGNRFYTTSAHRLARALLPRAVTVEDVIAACSGRLPPEPKLPAGQEVPLPEQAVPPRLPLWRKLTAAGFALAALGVFLYAACLTKVTELLRQSPWWLYVIFIAALLGVTLSLGQRVAAPAPLQHKEKVKKRTLVAAVFVAALIPMTVFAGMFLLEGRYAVWVALAVLAEAMLPFFLVFEGRRPSARELVVLAALCALAVAGRSVFFMLPQVKPVLALTVIAGVSLGAESGFLVGSMTMLTSNLLFSQGPWTPWQMFAMGLCGFLSGLLFHRSLLRPHPAVLAAFGAFAAVVLYGGILNFSSALLWNAQNLSWKLVLTYCLAGLPMDLVHAGATAVFLLLTAGPLLEKLERVKKNYGL